MMRLNRIVPVIAAVSTGVVAVVVLGDGEAPGDRSDTSASAAAHTQAPERIWAPVWRKGPRLSTPRQGVGAIEVNGFIYAIGGAKGTTFLSTTEYAAINDDGSLTPWKPGPTLHEARGYIDVETHDGFLYVIGGGKGPAGSELLRSIERAQIRQDGSLGPWQQEAHAMVSPRRCAKTVIIDGSIYAVGGFGGDMLNSVEHSKVGEGAGTDEWLEEEERLTVMRYISGVKAVGAAVYVVGGHDQESGSGIKDVEWSTVVDEAGFGKWQQTAPLQVARYGLGLVAHGGRLYALGGTSGRFLDSIERTTIQPDGALGPWQVMKTKLSATRGMMGTVVHRDRVYLIGGAGTDSVEYASFDEAGEIGAWLTPQQLAAIEADKAAAPPVEARLPFVAQVVDAKRAAPYVYLFVKWDRIPEGIWVAGPIGDYEVGDNVRFGKGAMMTDFYSKQLGLRFPNVLFVTELASAE